MTFGGQTFDPEKDGRRLTSQLARVQMAMSDGQWRTLPSLSTLVKGSQASVSARLRDLRKPKFGGYLVERRRAAELEGLWEYRFQMIKGTQEDPRPAQLTPYAMRAAYEVFYKVWPRLTTKEQEAITPLGRWLAACLGEKEKIDNH